ncbi:hypothetical protein IC235_06325 [Hymenobacter sp. BT664]|uniref:T9SS type A sorting domain-containing protein n=1 Tax=Hymenobacter montanus TaxID=2771359 RepID=A0A927BBQ1_9BACT|nr:choice-of-anchor Q domain-containing protein [Hymenobacter montanus]MBD2767506.1 hypothetical protein [Hymenobacter montanus]
MKKLLLLSLLLGCGPSFAAIFPIANGDVAALVAAINTANTNGQADVINLASNGTYVFTTINNTVTGLPGGYIETEGPVALPLIRDDVASGFDLIINLNGSVLRLSSTAPRMRLLQRAWGPEVSWQLNGGTIKDFESPANNPAPRRGGGGGAVVVGPGDLFTSEFMTFDNCTSNSWEERAGGAISVGGSSTVTLKNSTYKNNTGTSHGGGVTVLLSDIVVENCVFDNNQCTRDGGSAIYVDGCMGWVDRPGGMGQITGCTFTNNTSRNFGAVFLQGYHEDKWFVKNCQFTNNKATGTEKGGMAGALWHSGLNNGTFDVSNTTFENNEAKTHGGAVACTRGTNNFTNCTFYGNKTLDPEGLGGALYNMQEGRNPPPLWFSTIVNCTFANNICGGYGGAWAVSNDSIGAIRGSVQNTIIANNRAYQQCGYPPPPGCIGYNNTHNCGGTLINNGNNLEYPERPLRMLYPTWDNPDDKPCFSRPVVLNSNAMPVINPLLSPPASNGGATRTMALQAGSPAINAGNCSGSSVPATDQRGRARVGACDIGAYEFSTPLPVELAAFSVVARGGVAHLSWRTASETSNAGFGVEVSSDGQQFRRLGWVAGQGSRAYPTDYAFADAGLAGYAGPLVYYRLQQVDEDGPARFSPVRSVPVPVGGALGLQLWPNPARQRVSVGGAEAGQAVQVYDLSGRLVLAATLPLSGPPELVLPASLPRGSYLVRVGIRAGRLVLE